MIHNKASHVRAINEALMIVREELLFVRNGLVIYNSDCYLKEYFNNRMSSTLARATALLVGHLDAMIICASETEPASDMSFKTYFFQDESLFKIQQELLGLRCPKNEENSIDFFCVANFWKHYFPYNNLPSQVDGSTVADYFITMDSDQKYGGIVQDLIIPMFNGARDILEILNQIHGDLHAIVAKL